MEIIFCDIYKKFIDECDMQIKYNEHLLKHFKFTTYFGDIRDLKVTNAAYVSPANTYGSFGGGIDLIYNQDMFPDIQKVVMEEIKKLDTKSVLKQSFDDLYRGCTYACLPIGEAIIIPLSDYERYESCYLISAPTMEFPTNVSQSDNAYRAFIALLKAVKKYNDENNNTIKTIICPGLCTGVGGMTPNESVKQIFLALNDYAPKN